MYSGGKDAQVIMAGVCSIKHTCHNGGTRQGQPVVSQCIMDYNC